jgi:hypothetical protein
MTISTLKEKLYERIATYWGGAEVVWGATNKVKPPAPLVVMRLGTVNRAKQPITQMINGIVFSAYPTETTLQIDLFTKGKTVAAEGGQYTENTAESDLMNFVNYLDSVATIEWSNENDVSVSLLNGVQDLSEIVNDSQWQYRAMCEFSVAFTQWAAEYNGVLGEESIVFDDDGIPNDVIRENWQQTASGGGTQALAEGSTSSFENVDPEIKEESENG